jgi:molybdenum cofactor cytidylyltransferase
MLGAVIPAAGQSRRMGQAKINLPWGSTTVLGQVVRTLLAGGLDEIVVVCGETEPAGAEAWPAGLVRLVHLPDAASRDMLASLCFGLRQVSAPIEAVLVAPADMPAVPLEVIQAVIHAWQDCAALPRPQTGQEAGCLVVPSYHMRRGHPWLLPRSLWPAVQALSPGQTLRDFLRQQADRIHYVPVDSAAVLIDLDTPQEYERHLPPAPP